MKVHRRNGGITPLVFNLDTKMEVSGQHYALCAVTCKERTPGTYHIGSWVDPSTGVDFWIREKCVDRTGLDSRTVQRVP